MLSYFEIRRAPLTRHVCEVIAGQLDSEMSGYLKYLRFCRGVFSRGNEVIFISIPDEIDDVFSSIFGAEHRISISS